MAVNIWAATPLQGEINKYEYLTEEEILRSNKK